VIRLLGLYYWIKATSRPGPDPPSPTLHLLASTHRRKHLLTRLQEGAANGAAVFLATFGPPGLIDWGRIPCSVHFAFPEDPYGLQIMAINQAFRHVFFAREELHDAFVRKRTAHLILSALYVPACLSCRRAFLVHDGPPIQTDLLPSTPSRLTPCDTSTTTSFTNRLATPEDQPVLFDVFFEVFLSAVPRRIVTMARVSKCLE
jgi:hypothetical protein